MMASSPNHVFSGFPHNPLVLHTTSWFSTQLAGFTHNSLVLHTTRWFSTQLAGFTHNSLVFYTTRWFSTQLAGFTHNSLVFYTTRWFSTRSISPFVEDESRCCINFSQTPERLLVHQGFEHTTSYIGNRRLYQLMPSPGRSVGSDAGCQSRGCEFESWPGQLSDVRQKSMRHASFVFH